MSLTIKRLIAATLLLLALNAGADARVFLGGGTSAAPSCVYNGSTIGSCLPSSNTSNTLSATDPVFTSTSVSLGFSASTAGGIARNGTLLTGYFAACPGAVGTSAGYAVNWCYTSAYLKACVTGGVPTNPPYWDEGFLSWPAAGDVIYNSRSDNTSFYNSIPAFSPVYTWYDTAASLTRRGGGQWPAFMTGVCGTPTYTDFVNSVAGNMPDLNTALRTLQTGESVEVKAAPSPMPFWPTTDNFIGPVADTSTTVHDVTVNLDSGVLIGYGNVSKGVLDVENNGTTINGNGAWIYWVQPGGSGGNQGCVAWDAGLDITVENVNCNMAPMGLVRADIRSGITTLLNDTFENNGCEDGSCAYGHNHNLYIGTVGGTAGFDTVNATNLFDPDVQERGWNFKMRAPNSNVTQSAFIARINNGASSPHGSMDFPCGGTHSVTYSALETNAFSHGASGNQTNFIVGTDEESGTNATTVGTGAGVHYANCPPIIYLPSAGSISGTVTGLNTFTTTTDPSALFPYEVYGLGYGSAWDLGASGLMVNGPAPVTSWTGPVAGVYTVTLGPCYSGEGTLPLAQGVPIYSCFAATSGSVTLYPQNALTVVTNTSTTASLSTPVNPAGFGIGVGDTVFDNSLNPTTVTSITGTGPYTIALSCPTPSGSGDCLYPAAWQTIQGPTLPTSVDFVAKGGPIQVTASTTGTSCDGANVLCGITFNPAGWQLSPDVGVYGTDVAAGCVVAGQIGSIQPVSGTGTTYTVGDHITLAGGTFEAAAVVAVATVSGGVPTSYTIVSGGVYTALPKTFMQGATTGSGTGAQLHYPFPEAIIGGSGGNFTVTLAQTSGANCITGATTNAVYQMLTPTNITFDHDIVIWDGVSPYGALSSVIAFNGYAASSAPNAFQSSTATNGLYFADSTNGITWGTTAGHLQLGSTDGGGNVFCNARTDLTTSARCAIPAFTAASFTASISGGVMNAPSGASACKPGMFVWDGQGEFNIGEPGYTVGGTRIVSGGPTSFVLSFPPGGVSTTDVASTTFNCGWGTPSSAFNGTIVGTALTINSGLAGSLHAGDYLADISGGVAAGTTVVSGAGTSWVVTPSQSVSAEYMVGVR